MGAARQVSATLTRVRLGDRPTQPLLAGLADEYRARYGDIDVLADAHADQFAAPDGAFVVLLDDGVTLAGGGLRRLDATTAEVKRMWTSPRHRRQGLARVVLRGLEQVADELGYRRIRLETGPHQPEAVGLYASLGYERIAVYGPYELAIAFERDLPRQAPGHRLR